MNKKGMKECPKCEGEGMIKYEDGWKICPTCKGWGEILEGERDDKN